MTDRHAGYLVVLERDVRDDDAAAIIAALGMVKGVLSVDPVLADYREQIMRIRVDEDWRTALYRLASRGPEALDGP
ncbi:hypothetical protein ACFFMN_23545 [Planobispora siamensis]|uniref:Uncharacterized protein n=1 Tax=Planobispora siamensis TaxID=936338 RepID=A0A8J3SLA5_9ACTN|nr:hypothetical protein [Planobispora siamensis]GIH95339.1 hypothetical protein Psi01_59690 [Planobispora siamensis]